MSGGRASNPGFSSTKGIQIYTGKFSQVTYDAASGTVVIGTGQSWDNVYQQLQEHNVTVVGGRVNGVSKCDPPSWCDLNHIANRLALAASYSVEVGLWRVSVSLYTDASPTRVLVQDQSIWPCHRQHRRLQPGSAQRLSRLCDPVDPSRPLFWVKGRI
jgi:hypothetical protein